MTMNMRLKMKITKIDPKDMAYIDLWLDMDTKILNINCHDGYM